MSMHIPIQAVFAIICVVFSLCLLTGDYSMLQNIQVQNITALAAVQQLQNIFALVAPTTTNKHNNVVHVQTCRLLGHATSL